MSNYILIEERATGKTKLHVDTYEWEDDYMLLYQWTEGNYECDCNRGLFFDGEEHDCNMNDSDRKYSITIYDSEGDLLYADS